MTAVIRARVRRRPDIDVASLTDLKPIMVSGGWGWHLHLNGAPVSTPERAASGITHSQSSAIDEACAALKWFGRHR